MGETGVPPPANRLREQAWFCRWQTVEGLFSKVGVDDEGDRAVVDEGDGHHGAEAAAGDGTAEGGGGEFEKFFVEGNRNFGARGVVEGGARAFARAGDERELADDEKTAGGVAHGEVHLALGVGENAECADFFGEPEGVGGGVGGGDAE